MSELSGSSLTLGVLNGTTAYPHARLYSLTARWLLASWPLDSRHIDHFTHPTVCAPAGALVASQVVGLLASFPLCGSEVFPTWSSNISTENCKFQQLCHLQKLFLGSSRAFYIIAHSVLNLWINVFLTLWAFYLEGLPPPPPVLVLFLDYLFLPVFLLVYFSHCLLCR